MVLLLFSLGSFAQELLPDSIALQCQTNRQGEALLAKKSFNEVREAKEPGALSEIGRIFTTRENLVYLAFGGSLALQISQFDGRLSKALRDRDSQDLDEQIPTALGGIPGSVGIPVGTYVLGKLIDDDHLAWTAKRMGEALVVSEAVTLGLKLATHRRRPDGSDHRSFPSGHASGSFALASVVDQAYGHRVGFPLYGVASWIGLSRIRLQKHYPSDVIGGATLGIIVGRTLGAPRAGKKTWSFLPAVTPYGSMIALVKQF